MDWEVYGMPIELTDLDKRILDGKEGKAKQMAMRVIVKMAEIQGAERLIDVEQAHIDGCIYTGPASLLFAETMANLGGKAVIPTTMNAISVDRKRWKTQGVDPEWAHFAERLADAYIKMGAQPTFTCAPYQLPNHPKLGKHIAWAESNAVVFANSVLGARTNRYGDLMDLCAALTGRVPLSGFHLDENRKGTIVIDVDGIQDIDSFFYPVLGYLVGKIVNGKVPVIVGLHHQPSADDLKAFGAAAATAGAVALFHIVGITPEAPTVDEALGYKAPEFHYKVTHEQLKEVWESLSSAGVTKVDLITLGSPHFSSEEFRQLSIIIEEEARSSKAKTDLLITTSNHVYEQAKKCGVVEKIEAFGARFLTDTCLCMINTPVIPKNCQTLMTNSAKYAHYAPGLVNRKIYFSSLRDCVKTAVSGNLVRNKPKWLTRL